MFLIIIIHIMFEFNTNRWHWTRRTECC